MLRRPPRSTLTYTLCPSTTLVRSLLVLSLRLLLNSPSLPSAYLHHSAQSRASRFSTSAPTSRSSRPSCRCSTVTDHCSNHRSEENTSELKSLMRIQYADFCLKKKNKETTGCRTNHTTFHILL